MSSSITANDVFDYLEGYGISDSVISKLWVQNRIDNLVIPWVEENTRLAFISESETTEYYSGTGKSILVLSRKPINEIISLEYISGESILNLIELDSVSGIIIMRNNNDDEFKINVFRSGTKNIKIVYKFGFNNFVDSQNNKIIKSVKEAVLCLASKQVLIQIGSRTGGGSINVKDHGRDYGARGKYTDIINNLDMVAFELLRPYMSGTAST